MPIEKAVTGNAYGSNGPYDLTGVPPTLSDDLNLEEYRPTATFSISSVYLTAGLPSASGNLGKIVWVYDSPAGTQLQFSNGTSWISIQY